MATGIRAASNLGGYAAASSTIRNRQRAPTMRRLSDDDACSPGVAVDSHVLAEFLEGGAEPCCGLHLHEPQHGVVPLLDRSMILFDPVVQVLALAMPYLPAQNPADRLAAAEGLVIDSALRAPQCEYGCIESRKPFGPGVHRQEST